MWHLLVAFLSPLAPLTFVILFYQSLPVAVSFATNCYQSLPVAASFATNCYQSLSVTAPVAATHGAAIRGPPRMTNLGGGTLIPNTWFGVGACVALNSWYSYRVYIVSLNSWYNYRALYNASKAGGCAAGS